MGKMPVFPPDTRTLEVVSRTMPGKETVVEIYRAKDG
jgi:hypothetical protein